MNEDIIYVDYLDSYLDVTKNTVPKWIKKILYKFLNYMGFIKCRKNYLQVTCVENDVLNEKAIKNFINKIKSINTKNIVLADIFSNNKKFINILESLGYFILDGSWLYKFLAIDIVKKISYTQNLELQKMEITVVSNNDSDINIEIIKGLAQKCKVLNILTERIDKFETVERFLFEEYGVIINVSSNKKKTCLYSDVVLNFDFSVERINKCKFRKNTILVQFTNEKFENRNGVTIVSVKLNLPLRYIDIFQKFNHFYEEILYESLIFHKLSYENCRKILEKDDVTIRYFIGNNGKIDFKEIKSCKLENNLGKNA